MLLIISATSGVILCLLIIAVRWLLISRRRPKDDNSEQGKVPGQFKNSNTGETTITNGFSADDISEIDADIDLTTSIPLTSGSNGKNDVSRTFVFLFALFIYREKYAYRSVVALTMILALFAHHIS